MKRYRFRLCLFLLLFLLLPIQVFGAGRIDTDKKASLTVSSQYDAIPITGMQFDAYLVADVDAYGELTVKDAFSEYSLDIHGKNDAAWQEAAALLEQKVVLEGRLPDASVVTDQEGNALFQELTPGLYLIVVNPVEQGTYVYTSESFFVLLPEEVDNEWNYQVSAAAKVEQGPKLADYQVIKIWKDEGQEAKRPDSITVQLMCDGKAYGDPVTLPVDGRWEYCWTNLDTNHKWTVTEHSVSGYRGKVVQDGYQFILTNTKTSTTGTTSKLPQTGQTWWPIPLLLCGGILLVIVGLIRRRKHEA